MVESGAWSYSSNPNSRKRPYEATVPQAMKHGSAHQRQRPDPPQSAVAHACGAASEEEREGIVCPEITKKKRVSFSSDLVARHRDTAEASCQ